MRLKLTMLVLLLSSSLFYEIQVWPAWFFENSKMQDYQKRDDLKKEVIAALKKDSDLGSGLTFHFGLLGPSASVDWNVIRDNPITSCILLSSFAAGAYLTTEYWYHSIVKLLHTHAQQNVGSAKKEESSALDFIKSGARIYRPHEIETRLKDVAGLQSVKLDVFDIIQFLKNPKAYHDMGAKIPSGMLFEGPPGVGKTLLAKAIAGECGCPFISLCASEFEEVFVGVGASRIRDLFAKAKELSPCIIFIDEFDAIGKKRVSGMSGASDGQAQALAQLLTCMDGFDMHKYPIIVLAATNRVEVLDPAVLRPGRFDRIIQISLPYLKDRIEILKVHLQHVKTDHDIDVSLIARSTMGFSGAELANLVNEAAILAVNEHASCVEMKHIDQAYDNITLGRETQGMDDQYEEEIFEIAIHEAGHSIVRVFLEDAAPLYKVTITPRTGALGISFARPLRETYNYKESTMKAQIVICLAGALAEKEFGFGQNTGRSNDIQVARAIAYDMVTKYGMAEALRYISYAGVDYNLSNDVATKIDAEVKKIIDECYEKAQDLVREHKIEIEQLARLLMTQGTVFGDVVYRMCGVLEPKIEFGLAK